MKRLFSVMLCLLIACIFLSGSTLFNISSYASEDTQIPYDLDKCSPYAQESVSRMVAMGIISGDAQGYFNPFVPITRAQFVTMLVRLLELDLFTPQVPTFKDVPKSHWAYSFVETAYREGLISGVSSTSFAPDAICTREQIGSLLTRYFPMSHELLEKNRLTTGILDTFSDKNQISAWALGALSYACSNGLILGNAGNLMPKEPATREQTAIMLDRYLQWYRKNLVDGIPLSIGGSTFYTSLAIENVHLFVNNVTDKNSNTVHINKIMPDWLYNPDYKPVPYIYLQSQSPIRRELYETSLFCYSNPSPVFIPGEFYSFDILVSQKKSSFYADKTVYYSPAYSSVKYAVPVGATRVEIVIGYDISKEALGDPTYYSVADSRGKRIPIRSVNVNSGYVTLDLAETPLPGERYQLTIKGIKDRLNRPVADYSQTLVFLDRQAPYFTFAQVADAREIIAFTLEFDEYMTADLIVNRTYMGKVSGLDLSRTYRYGAKEAKINSETAYLINVSDGRNSTPIIPIKNLWEKNYSNETPIRSIGYKKDKNGRVSHYILNLDAPLLREGVWEFPQMELYDSAYKFIGVEEEFYIKTAERGTAKFKKGGTQIEVPVAKGLNLKKGSYKVILTPFDVESILYGGYGSGNHTGHVNKPILLELNIN